MTRLHPLLWSLTTLVAAAVADQTIPYTPTRLLRPANSSFVHIFQNATLQALDISNSFSAGEIPHVVLSASLPFATGSRALPYTPIIETSGNITVITGNCSENASDAQVWRFVPDQKSLDGNGTWTQHDITVPGAGGQINSSVSQYLSNGLAFSSDVEDGSAGLDLYVFGGMCPYENSTMDTWTTAATYSSAMLALSQNSSIDGGITYDVETATDSLRGPPVAEAGFSITALEPTYTFSSNGKTQARQQDFLLLGGHTHGAFINVSQLALYSLPQQSWTYFPVNQPNDAKTELAARDAATSVEPRSGHTAVLSEDGSTVVVFGGWVGNVSTPAKPQLAMLHVDSGYGGTAEDWSWSVPDQTGDGPAAGSGIYGHGAIMLPGDVMMVLGGYSIPASSSQVTKRDGSSANTNVLLYNISSRSWISSYTAPPSAFTIQSKDNTSHGALSRTSQQAGLGVGLGVGLLILLGLIIFSFWYTRRLKRMREERERAILTHSSDGSYGQPDQPFLEKLDTASRSDDPYSVGRYFNDRERVASGSHKPPVEMESAGSTGLFVDTPSPTRGLRKGATGRPYSYHAAPRYDDKRVSKGSGSIHPIVEHEDEDGMRRPMTYYSVDGSESERRLKEVERVLDHSPAKTLHDLERALTSVVPAKDPFRDPQPNPLGSHPVSPTIGETVRRVPTNASRAASPPRRPPTLESEHNWEPCNDNERGEPSHGRVSPTKSEDRTSSSLSEHSLATNASMARTLSTRTGAMLAATFLARNQADANNEGSYSSSSDDNRTNTMSSGRASPFYWQTRPRSTTNDTTRPGASAMSERSVDSFATAKTSFGKLQSEGEALLGGRPAVVDRDDPYQRAMAAHRTASQRQPAEDQYGDIPGALLPTRRRPGWMGSLRRAITAMSSSERSFSLTTTAATEPCEDDPRSRSISPVKPRKRPTNPNNSNNAPRRAVSDGGALLKQKRGQKDWDDKGWTPYRDDPDPGDWGEPRSSLEKKQAEEDWDVEGASNKRDFQVMFTVPKSRLRVVNADADRASLRSASDSTISRAGSVNNLRSEGSVRSGRRRSDELRSPVLSSTAEEYEDVVGGASSLLVGSGKGKEKAV